VEVRASLGTFLRQSAAFPKINDSKSRGAGALGGANCLAGDLRTPDVPIEGYTAVIKTGEEILRRLASEVLQA